MVYGNSVLWQYFGVCSDIWTCDKIPLRRNKLTVCCKKWNNTKATLYWMPKWRSCKKSLYSGNIFPSSRIACCRQGLSQLPFPCKMSGLLWHPFDCGEGEGPLAEGSGGRDYPGRCVLWLSLRKEWALDGTLKRWKKQEITFFMFSTPPLSPIYPFDGSSHLMLFLQIKKGKVLGALDSSVLHC